MFNMKQSSYWTLLNNEAVRETFCTLSRGPAIPRMTQEMARALKVLIRGERFAKLRRWSIAKMSLEVLRDQAASPPVEACYPFDPPGT
jgi:hypothetical protein